MTVHLRTENCCCTPGCKRPAWQLDLCAMCFMAAPPHVRAVQSLAARRDPVCPDYPPVWLGGKAA
jgi:hypothetical protein